MVCPFVLFGRPKVMIVVGIQANLWCGFEGGFVTHMEQVERDLAAVGLPSLVKASPGGRQPSSQMC